MKKNEKVLEIPACMSRGAYGMMCEAGKAWLKGIENSTNKFTIDFDGPTHMFIHKLPHQVILEPSLREMISRVFRDEIKEFQCRGHLNENGQFVLASIDLCENPDVVFNRILNLTNKVLEENTKSIKAKVKDYEYDKKLHRLTLNITKI